MILLKCFQSVPSHSAMFLTENKSLLAVLWTRVSSMYLTHSHLFNSYSSMSDLFASKLHPSLTCPPSILSLAPPISSVSSHPSLNPSQSSSGCLSSISPSSSLSYFLLLCVSFLFHFTAVLLLVWAIGEFLHSAEQSLVGQRRCRARFFAVR